MFEAAVAPAVGDAGTPPASRAFRVAGVREPDAAERVGALALSRDVETAFYPHEGELEIRFTARGPGAVGRAERAAATARRAFGPAAYDDVPIQVAVVHALAARKLDVTTAESLTGGLVARMLVEVPGASDVFPGGWVTYSDAWKREALGVSEELLRTYGAVSSPVAAAMAVGARERAGVAYAIAATGLAGPGDGQTPAGERLEAGTFFVALASREEEPVVQRHASPLGRATVQRRAAVAALDLLRRRLPELADRQRHD